MRRLITLTTDFGTDDGYVGTIKGVVLSINPDVNIIDISHGVRPQNVLEGAFIFGTSYRFFPRDTVHVVVVDPGVGTERKPIALRTPSAIFVAPNNGVLSWMMRDLLADSKRVSVSVGGAIDIRDFGIEAVQLTNAKFWLSAISTTFHARDIFAPVAAHITLGVPLNELGEPTDKITVLPLPMPERRPDGAIVGHIVYVDRFGNLITDLRPDDVAQLPGEPIFEILGRTIVGLSRCYAERQGLLAIIGSSGYIEIAVSSGSAAAELRARREDVVVVRATF